MKKIQTLCMISENKKILLGMKKRGFGEGNWNGFGGKPESDESIEDALIREVKEEVGLEVSGLEKMGVIEFHFQDDEDSIEVHIFKTNNYSGEITESEEMKPQWFDVTEIPFNSMWPDDIYWVPLFLENKKFKGKFLFDKNINILEKELIEVDFL